MTDTKNDITDSIPDSDHAPERPTGDLPGEVSGASGEGWANLSAPTTDANAAIAPAPVAPPVDNDYVAPGAEQFTSAPAPQPPIEPPKVTPSPAPSPEPTPSPATSSSATADQTPEPAAADAPAPLIMPTVGRVVWYWPKGTASTDGEQPQAGLVTFVHDAHTVNLVTFGHDGFPLPRHSAHLVQPDEPAPTKGGYACWMPFQVGQARAARQSPAAA